MRARGSGVTLGVLNVSSTHPLMVQSSKAMALLQPSWRSRGILLALGRPSLWALPRHDFCSSAPARGFGADCRNLWSPGVNPILSYLKNLSR